MENLHKWIVLLQRMTDELQYRQHFIIFRTLRSSDYLLMEVLPCIFKRLSHLSDVTSVGKEEHEARLSSKLDVRTKQKRKVLASRCTTISSRNHNDAYLRLTEVPHKRSGKLQNRAECSSTIFNERSTVDQNDKS